MSIRDSNLQLLKHESSPITTGPGLPPNQSKHVNVRVSGFFVSNRWGKDCPKLSKILGNFKWHHFLPIGQFQMDPLFAHWAILNGNTF